MTGPEIDARIAGLEARIAALESRTPIAFVHTTRRNASGLITQVFSEPVVPPEDTLDESALR